MQFAAVSSWNDQNKIYKINYSDSFLKDLNGDWDDESSLSTSNRATIRHPDHLPLFSVYKPLFSMSALSYAGLSRAPLSASSATRAWVTTKLGEVTSLFSSATPRRKLGRNFLWMGSSTVVRFMPVAAEIRFWKERLCLGCSFNFLDKETENWDQSRKR